MNQHLTLSVKVIRHKINPWCAHKGPCQAGVTPKSEKTQINPIALAIVELCLSKGIIYSGTQSVENYVEYKNSVET